MTGQTTKAPGWYLDPEDPAFIRYWDGRLWSEQRRPRPGWAPPMTPEEEAAHHAAMRRRTWYLRGAGTLAVGALVVLTLLAVRSDLPDIPARSVADTGFTTAAQGICARRMPAIRNQPTPPGEKDLDEALQLAAKVERTATELSSVLGELRGLPVAAADQAEVGAWLDDWQRFVEVGHRYAAALRTDKPSHYTKVGKEGNAPSRRIYVFAKANGMPDCVFEVDNT